MSYFLEKIFLTSSYKNLGYEEVPDLGIFYVVGIIMILVVYELVSFFTGKKLQY